MNATHPTDASPAHSTLSANEHHNAIRISLYPANYKEIEIIKENGAEVFAPAVEKSQAFLQSLDELKKERLKEFFGKNIRTDLDEGNVKKLEDVDDDVDSTGKEAADVIMEEASDTDEVIDPRIYYRPMVKELQAAIIETNQLINTIDLIRRREFLEEMYCMRENTALQKDELIYLIEAKGIQLTDASQILLAGVESLSTTVEKECVFFQGLQQLIRKWNLCAPYHGNIPKPFRAGEPLAVNCTYSSAGSMPVLDHQRIHDLAYAELCRTDKGLVRVQPPEQYTPKTLCIELHCKNTGERGKYTLQGPSSRKLNKKSDFEMLSVTASDIKLQEQWNDDILRAVQFSYFCEETFEVLKKEVSQSGTNWTGCIHARNSLGTANKLNTTMESLRNNFKRSSRKRSSARNSVCVSHVFNDEIGLQVTESHLLEIKLVDVYVDDPQDDSVSITDKEPTSEVDFLSHVCRSAMVLLQQEVREHHGYHDTSHEVYTTDQPEAVCFPLTILTNALEVISHGLLVHDVTNYLDQLSAKLAMQGGLSSGGRISESETNQPICDSTRGVYISCLWKACPDSARLTAVDLTIGNNYTTEILIDKTEIRIEDSSRSTFHRLTKIDSFRVHVERMIQARVTTALYKDLVSFGMRHVSLELDRRSVRVILAGGWDGSCIGEGRIAETKAAKALYMEPQFTNEKLITIRCYTQGLSIMCRKSKGEDHQFEVAQTSSPKLHSLDWSVIPGSSDSAKILWILQKTNALPQKFQVHAPEK